MDSDVVPLFFPSYNCINFILDVNSNFTFLDDAGFIIDEKSYYQLV